RFVDANGKPVVGHWPEVEMVFVPGPHRYSPESFKRGEFAADSVHLANVYRKGYQSNSRTDKEGRVVLRGLVPGVTHLLTAIAQGGRILREFTVRPGEELELKDVVLGPQR